MTIAEATKLRDEYIKVLVGKQYDSRRPNWAIKDVIVSDQKNAAAVYHKMYDASMSNEEALRSFTISADSYDAWIIAHPLPLNDEQLQIENVQQYIHAGMLE